MGDQLVEGRRTSSAGTGTSQARVFASREHEPSLLVAAERGPRTVAVDANRLRIEHLLDDVRGAAREPQCREQTERDRVAVCETVVAGRRLQCVRERVPEVEDRATTLVERIAEADRRLEGCRTRGSASSSELPERAACEQPRLHHLGHPLTSLRLRSASRARPGRRRLSPDSGMRRRGSCPVARSSAVLPPIAASTWPSNVVGTAIQRTPRM